MNYNVYARNGLALHTKLPTTLLRSKGVEAQKKGLGPAVRRQRPTAQVFH